MKNLEKIHSVKFVVVKNDSNSPSCYVDLTKINKGVICIQSKVLSRSNLRDCLLHEIGHVLDYRDDKARFYTSMVVSGIQKHKILKMKKGKERVKKYHATSFERRANAYFNLTYKNFCK